MSSSLLQKASIISIEGNIGSGKSTLMSELKIAFAELPHVVFLEEPVDDWNTIRDDAGLTMLEKFYGNQEKYSFSFQMMAYISRLATIRKAIRENPGCVFISERCLHTDKYVFAKMLYDDNKIESVDYQIYNKWFDTFVDDFDVTNIVYIKADHVLGTRCATRTRRRSRHPTEIPTGMWRLP
jgi:deoxyadenosine/deoxycytidine kinase